MKISVVIPAKDAAATIVETLDSIACQTLRPYEVIVVDDGSTDETASLAAAHPINPRVLHQAAGGVASALNAGCHAAAGEALAMLDSDDLWTPGWLQRTAEALGHHTASAVFGEMETFLDSSISAEEAAGLRYQKSAKPAILSGACVMRRDVFVMLGGFDERFKTGQFIDFFHRFKTAGFQYVFVEGDGLRRRIRPGSLTRQRAVGSSLSEQALSRDFLSVVHEALKRRRQEGERDK